jgi:hypothetical protein
MNVPRGSGYVLLKISVSALIYGFHKTSRDLTASSARHPIMRIRGSESEGEWLQSHAMCVVISGDSDTVTDCFNME